MSAAWRIRQLGKERLAALEKKKELEELVRDLLAYVPSSTYAGDLETPGSRIAVDVEAQKRADEIRERAERALPPFMRAQEEGGAENGGV